MNKFANSNRYRSINSMKELRMEREKLRWQMRTVEDNLSRDYQEVCSMLSFANITRMVFSKIENIQALVSGIRDGYHSITDLFKKK